MIVKIIIVLFLITLILIFTFILPTTQNPITNVHINYFDETLVPEQAESMVHRVAYTILPTHINDMFIIKTAQRLRIEKLSLYSKVYGIKMAHSYLYLVVSMRYQLVGTTPLDNAYMFTIKDAILTMPYVPGLIKYHLFNIIVDSSETVDENEFKSCPAASLILSEYVKGILVTPPLEIESEVERKLYDNPFTTYAIGFGANKMKFV